MHVVTLVFAVSTIPVLACLMVWLMGGTASQIAFAAVLAWLIVQALYVVQLVFGSLRQLRREARERDGSHDPSTTRADRLNGSFADCDTAQRD